MAIKFVNEELEKTYLTINDDTRIKYSSTLVGNTLKLRFEKVLEGGYYSDGVYISFVRLFFEKVPEATIKSVIMYKFGIPFTKKNEIALNVMRLPIKVTFDNDNGFVDVPVSLNDEIFEIELEIPTLQGYIYSAIDGCIHNLKSDALKKFRTAEGI